MCHLKLDIRNHVSHSTSSFFISLTFFLCSHTLTLFENKISNCKDINFMKALCFFKRFHKLFSHLPLCFIYTLHCSRFAYAMPSYTVKKKNKNIFHSSYLKMAKEMWRSRQSKQQLFSKAYSLKFKLKPN